MDSLAPARSAYRPLASPNNRASAHFFSGCENCENRIHRMENCHSGLRSCSSCSSCQNPAPRWRRSSEIQMGSTRGLACNDRWPRRSVLERRMKSIAGDSIRALKWRASRPPRHPSRVRSPDSDSVTVAWRRSVFERRMVTTDARFLRDLKWRASRPPQHPSRVRSPDSIESPQASHR